MPRKKVKNILFTSNSVTFTKRQLPLIIELERRGYNVTTISYSKQAENILKSKNKKVEYILDYFDKCKIKNVKNVEDGWSLFIMILNQKKLQE